ncbi:hypothetical protein Dimus_009049 [Dionaea muscipula]
MGNSLRCCLACVLPCGALDLIRIVHLNGHIQEVSGPITAVDFLRAYPDHALISKPCSPQGQAGVDRRRPGILILSPDAELQRGRIYLLIPESSLMDTKNRRIIGTARTSGGGGGDRQSRPNSSANKSGKVYAGKGDVITSRRFEFSDSVSAKNKPKSSRQDRKRGQVAAWRPHLHSICEDS